MANTLVFIDPEKIRLRCGLSRNQWAKLLETGDAGSDARAWEISKSFDRFLDRCRLQVDYEFQNPEFVEDGQPYISTIQAARALSVGEFHLANLRDRGKLASVRVGRRAGFRRDDLLDFLDIDRRPDTRQTALGVAFFRWFELEEQEASRKRNRRRDTSPALAGV